MEASAPPERRDYDRRVEERQPTGWTVFAGALLFIAGSLDALWGLAGILNDEIVFVGGQGVMIADVTTWGWIHLILGSIVTSTGLGLFAGANWARMAAVFFVTINTVTQIVWFPAAPLWAFLMIILNVTIIYQLTVRWAD
jgi:hypothetical protein